MGSMAGKFEKPTIKQHLAAIRMLFDYLVVGQILAINPAHAVSGPKHSVKRSEELEGIEDALMESSARQCHMIRKQGPATPKGRVT